MQSLIVTFVTKSGCEQALVDTIIDLQRETALEAGVIRYELLQGAPGTRTFLLYERYADEEALKTHRASPYLQAALVKL
ncbi:MAG: antibiotic biosynthesis monooxygenase family protein, partial [Opitutaceae bacterium]